MTLTVVVPTYRRRSLVAMLLEALTDQTLPPSEFEVVVSVDGSKDGTMELIQDFDAAFPLRALWGENRGRAAACNAGIRAATGHIVVLLDDDMRPTPGLLEAHRAAHRFGGQRCVVGAAPITIHPGSPPLTRFVARKFNSHLLRLAEPGHVFGVRDFYSGNASVPRDVLVAAGLFDEQFSAYGNEDLELAMRLRALDIELVFSAEASAEQRYEKEFPQLARDTIGKGKTAVQFALKHPQALPELQLAQFRDRSWRWRVVRDGLLRLTSFASVTPSAVMALTSVVERLPFARLDLYYSVLIDYFYWVGAREALAGSTAERAAAGWPLLT